MRLLPAILIALAIVLAPVLWYVIPMMLPEEAVGPGDGGPAVDSYARIELEMVRQMLEATQEGVHQQAEGVAALNQKIGELERRLESAEALARQGGAASPLAPGMSGDGLIAEGEDPGTGAIDFYTQVVLIADRRNVNKGLEIANPSFLQEFLGRPRESLSDNCEPMTNDKLKNMLVTEQVGPIQVTMLQPAIDSLKIVFENIRRADPHLYERINTAGSLCVRRIRGSASSVSTHSFGLSVDLNIDGILDRFADGRTQMGLMIMKDFFKAEGWFWGAGFGREDSMHFEVSRGKLEEWRAQGKI